MRVSIPCVRLNAVVFICVLFSALCLPALGQPDPAVTRDVTIQLKNSAGKPAVDTPVKATYCRGEEVVYRDAATDAKGELSLHELPAVRVIVWGADVPAVVIDAKTEKITLLTKQPENFRRNINLRIELNGLAGGTLEFYHDKAYGLAGSKYFKSDENPFLTRSLAVTPATRMSFCIALRGEKNYVGVVDNLFCPFLDGNPKAPYIDVQTAPAVALECRFRLNGKAVPRVNRLEFTPLDIKEQLIPISLMNQPNYKKFAAPQLLKDGYRVLLSGVGKYVVNVDLFDDTVEPLPALIVDVPKEGKSVTIDLPEPLLQLTPGTEVSWTTRSAPRSAQKLTVMGAAGENTVPVFGPRKGLLSAWYVAPANMLQIWHGDDNKLYPHLLRRTIINVETPEDENNNITLLPMLITASNAGSINSHLARTTLEPSVNELPTFWSGSYFAVLRGFLHQFEVGEPTDAGVKIVLKPDDKPAIPGLRPDARPVYLNIPDVPVVEKPPVPKGGVGPAFRTPICMVFEDDQQFASQYITLRKTEAQMISVSKTAKALSFYYPGAGSINAQIAPAGDEKTTITLTDWQPGVTVSGQITGLENKLKAPIGKDPIGKDPNPNPPIGRQPVNITVTLYVNSNVSLNTSVDAEGRFVFNNLLPGNVSIECDGNVWPLSIPDGGMKDITLSSEGGINITGANGMWWLPEDGAPIPLLSVGGNEKVCGLPLGDGMFWSPTGVMGGAGCGIYRRTLQPGTYVAISNQSQHSAGSYLGLSLPIKEGDPEYLGKVIVTGRGKLEGFSSSFDSSRVWFPSAEFGQYLGQIGPLPAGDYTITATTPAGNITRDVTVPEYGVWVDLGKDK